jgi:amino acid adenylation domain-containing protein
LPICLDASLSAALKTLSQRHGTSLFMTLLAAWACVLSRLSGQDDVVIGTPTANRQRAEVAPLIGFFVNTLALRIDLSGEPSVAELLARVRQTALAAQDHQDLPFEHVVEAAQPPRRLDHTPLFQVLLAWQGNDSATLQLPDIQVESAALPFDSVKFDLDLVLGEHDGAIQGSLHYATALFDAATVTRYRDYLTQVFRAIVADVQQPVTRIDLLGTAERHLLLDTWNPLPAIATSQRCIHQCFEAQAVSTPDAVALIDGDQRMTYAELNASANRLAHALIEQGVHAEALVALCVERGVGIVIGVLGILKAGAAYVPLDPAYPGARLTGILADATPAYIVSDEAGRQALGSTALDGYPLLDVQQLAHDPRRQHTNPNVSVSPHHLAYVIYTSGSTGTPKGVMVEHAQVTRLFEATDTWFGFNADDTWCLFHSYAFDFSVWELWGALLYGGRLVIVPHAVARSPGDFHALVCASGVTVLNQTPSAFKSFIEADRQHPQMHRLRYVIFGGEALEPAMLRPWYARYGDRSPSLINMYGITETTVHVTYRPLRQHDAQATGSPIGRCIPDLRCYVLDAHRQPVPLGAVGELYVGGAGVARGYLNRPQLSAERFLVDPFSDLPNARMYRSGDLARYLPDGSLLYLGRNDQQVKIRGFRIEPGEIEARLLAHAAVREAVVVAHADGAGDKQLIAYVTTHADADVTAELPAILRAHLAQGMPDYMLPSACVVLDALPLTGNGKLDRDALPAPAATAYAHARFEAPQTDHERMLAQIWQELLGLERVGRHDNFFALGGHSLLAVQHMERLRRVGLSLDVRALFASPTLSELAATVGACREVVTPDNPITARSTAITPSMLPLIALTQADIDRIVEQVPGGIANIQDIYALSPLQDGILFHHLMADEGDPYLLRVQLAFADRARLDRFLDAVQRVVDRHDMLRTAFVWEQLSAPAQVVWRHAPLQVTDVTPPAGTSALEQLQQRCDPRHLRMNLGRAPLLRFMIAQEAESGRWLVVQLMHHLIGDHSTLETLLSEVHAFMDERGDTLPPPQPFRHLVAQARLGMPQHEHEAFFRRMLADIEEPAAPFGLTDVHHDGRQVGEAHRMLPQTLNDGLRAQARRLGVSLASLCHLAWGQVVARTSGREAVVFGTVLFGRMAGGQGADRAMGLFINTLPLRLDLDDTDVETCARHTHARLAELLSHEHASLALAQRCSGVAAPAPLFSTLLNYRHNTGMSRDHAAPPHGMEWLGSEERTNYPFAMSVEDFGNALALTAQVMEPIAAERFCDYLQQALASLLEALENPVPMPVCELEILPLAERQALCQQTTETAGNAPYGLHQRFEQHARETPQRIAITDANLSLTYAQANQQANRIAHWLLAHGVQPDDRVALCTARQPMMMVAALAILKAGACYVPLDPAYASERLAQMLEDAAPKLLIVDRIGRMALGEAHVAAHITFDLDEASSLIDAAMDDRDPSVAGLSSAHLAYVIYTSGSTGLPKGVMVEHAQVCNLFDDWQRRFPDFGQGDIFHTATSASMGFDVSVFEWLLPLCTGGTLNLAPDDTRSEPARLLDWLVSKRIASAYLSPFFVKELGRLPVDSLSRLSLRYLLVGVEPLREDLLHRLQTAVPGSRIVNAYGPTEATVFCTVYADIQALARHAPIGRPIANTRIYLLDPRGRPVPVGVTGEIHIGGASVARGYWNRPALTEERFVADPFAPSPHARMYRTGDLARYLADGELEFLGRNDHQIKIRGFRVEPGEIETRLAMHPAVHAALVMAREDSSGERRLVAYVIAEEGAASEGTSSDILRAHLSKQLPDYMLPSAFVPLKAWPLTPNGKLDRKALPAPADDAYARGRYEPPQGEIEQLLAAIWESLLGVTSISRHDNFFELGGHSLLAVQMMERLRSRGLTAPVRSLFATPVLAELALLLGGHREATVPVNGVMPDSTSIVPEMLPLITLNQEDIDHIVAQVPGGIANIQDIYALSPLQDGILFHHLLAQHGDPYLLASRMAFADRSQLDRYLAALQQVVDRHNILRTAFMWEQLSSPAQVVLRQAPIRVTEITLDPSVPAQQQLAQHADSRRHRIPLANAPLLRFVIAREPDSERWLAVQWMHHLIGDHSTLETLLVEIRALLLGQGATLPPAQPFRHLIAQARLGHTPAEHERFFRGMLGDIDAPTTPFGLVDVHRESQHTAQAHRMLPQALNDGLRAQARRLGVSLASLCHLAWGQVVARASGRESVVFGTVLFGRMAAGDGADRAMGLFINTLPLRLDLDDTDVETSVRRAHTCLAELLAHEHASLALAQHCSGVAATLPLFSALLNYRHNSVKPDDAGVVDDNSHDPLRDVEWLGSEERTNYPFTLSVEDFGDALGVTAQVSDDVSAERVCGYMQQALESLCQALQQHTSMAVRELEVVPPEERALQLETWNRTEAEFPHHECIHTLFERRVRETPEAVAITYGDQALSYTQLNARANRLAHYLIAQGVRPDDRIALCTERNLTMTVGMLAILKAGGAFVPIDPAYPSDRLAQVLRDSQPVLLLCDDDMRGVFDEETLRGLRIVAPNASPSPWQALPDTDPDAQTLGITPDHLAYLIYTSGSSGVPKGVMVEHRGVVNLANWQRHQFRLEQPKRIAQMLSFGFDGVIGETVMALLNGGTLSILQPEDVQPERLVECLNQKQINVLVATPSLLTHLDVAAIEHPDELAVVSVGEACSKELASTWMHHSHFMNGYGPTEYTVYSHLWEAHPAAVAQHERMPIGKAMHNTRTYILDSQLRPLPIGAVGEIYLSGEGTARGYLHWPQITAERFIPNPFVLAQEIHDHGWLQLPVAVRDIEGFVAMERSQGGTDRPASPDWLAPDALLSRCDRLDDDLRAQAQSFIERHRDNDMAYRGFCRYFLEGANDSYAAHGLPIEALSLLLDCADFTGLHGVELGCGNGEVLQALQQAGAHVIGFDLSPCFVQHVRNKGLHARMASVDVAPTDMSNAFGVAAASQDFAISTMVLDRIGKPVHLLQNLFALLKPGGRFALQTILPVIPVDDGEVSEPIVYTQPDDRITAGRTAESDKLALAMLLRKLGAQDVHVRKLPYAIVSRDGVQRYTLWSFAGRKRVADSLRHPYDRMYKTGDLGRWLPDGTVEYLGRNDFQIKLRGFRIEPGEIEARLLEHPWVREAAVIPREDTAGDKRLVAYVSMSSGVTEDESMHAILRTHLRTRLPDYMVPSAFVRLAALPLTPSGKIDRHKLPAPDSDAYAHRDAEPPQGDIETRLAAIWTELLGLAQIGRHDHFFELGGHSILAVRLMSRLPAAFGVRLPLATLFAQSTLAGFAGAIAAATPLHRADIGPAIVPAARTDDLPLSFAQQRLWFLAQREGVSVTYHMPLAMQLCGELDLDAWRRSLDTLYARHEALRTIFRDTHDGPRARLLPAQGFPLDFCDLREVADAPAQLARIEAETATMPFDLRTGPLLRSTLVRMAEQQHVFILVQHHIVSDGWSIGILLRELGALYAAYRDNQPDPLPRLPIQYPDYAAWQRLWLTGARLREQADYWRDTLTDAPVALTLPTIHPRPTQPSFAGAMVPLQLDATLTHALKQLSQRHGTTLFMTVLAAWAAVLARLSGQDDLVIGTPTAHRNRAELEPLLGFFVNTLALRIDLSHEPGVTELLARVRRAVLAAQEHEDLPFEQVVEIVNPPRRLEHAPLFQVMLSWQGGSTASLALPGLQAELMPVAFDAVKFDLELELVEGEETIDGVLRYATALFDSAGMHRLCGYLHAMLQAMARGADQTVSMIDILSAPERRQLLQTWNRTGLPQQSEQAIHHLFEAQARRTPDNIAIVDEDRSLTYAELDRHANQLAWQLIDHGVGISDRVATLLERSAELVIAQLAILKAGSAYVPIDPQIPVERQTWTLDDCDARLVLIDATQASTRGIDRPVLPVALLDRHVAERGNPDRNCGSDAIAYVMYTSGSTGHPKGVLVPHGGIRRLALENGYAPFDASDRIAFASNPAFDASTMEVWGALLNGSAVIVIDRPTVLDAPRLQQALVRHGVTTLFLTTALFNQYARSMATTLARLKYLLCGGERNDPESFRLILREHGRVQLIHCYGPTEATTYALTCRITQAHDGIENLPIGRPIAHTRAYILDVHRQPVPTGAVGELYIGGVGVARGYLNRPELSAERFLDDPFNAEAGARMYRSGDLVRYRADGDIEFVGRNDHQVKIRGFRIEPGEVEACLSHHPGVRDIIVLAREYEHGEKHLVAYVVMTQDDPEQAIAALREHVRRALPEYMVPAAFMLLEKLPLTPNGKVDRHALPSPDDQAFAHRVYVTPCTPTEKMLASIWAEELGIERVGRHDHFFELGGHSLLAVKMVSRCADFGWELSVNDLFQHPMLMDLAQAIKAAPAGQALDRALLFRKGNAEHPPIFFLPTGTGDYSYVFGLMRDIKLDASIYVLPWQAATQTPLPTLEAMATRMIAMMKAVQAAGPYHLIGYSGGGVLAYAMAEQLQGDDAAVAFLGMIDTMLLAPTDPQTDMQMLLDAVEHSTAAERVRNMALHGTVDAMLDELRHQQQLPPSLPHDITAPEWQQICHFMRTLRAYQPPPLPLCVHQFRATATVSALGHRDNPVHPVPQEYGWERVLPPSSMQYIDIPGDHFSMMSDPQHRAVLGEQLTERLATHCTR